MTKKIFYIDRYVYFSKKIFESITDILSNRKNFEITFLGSDDKDLHWLSNQKIINAKKVWTKGHFVRRIYNCVQKEKPDIIHFSFQLRTFGTYKSALKFPILLLLLKKTKSKVIITLHDLAIYKKDGHWKIVEDAPNKIPLSILQFLLKNFFKTICKLCDGIIVDNEFSKSGLVQFYGINEKKIQVIHFGFSDESKPMNLEIKEKLTKQFDGKKIILCFGMISPRKGHIIAIKAIKQISDELPNHILVISGKANWEFKSYENKLHKMVKSLGLENKVHFTGYISENDIDILFDLAEMVLFVYRPMSSISTAISYAIQHRKPSIVTNIDTFREILGNDSAIFIEPDNEQELADAILSLSKNLERKKSLQNQIKNVSERFTWKKAGEKHLVFYEKFA